MQNSYRLFFCGLFLLALLTLPVFAQQGKPEAPPKALDPQIVLMAKELKLTTAQTTKMQQKIDALHASIAKWSAANKEKKELYDKQLQTATKLNNKALIKAKIDQIMKLQQERNDLIAKRSKEVIDVLTPEQKLAWDVFKLQEGICNRYRTINLTEAQRMKIKTLCTTAVVKAKKLRRDNQKGRLDLHKRLIADIEKSVLTSAQRAQLKAEQDKQKAMMQKRRK